MAHGFYWQERQRAEIPPKPLSPLQNLFGKCNITLMNRNYANFEQTSGNRHTPTTAPARALTDKCGTVRGQIKALVMEKVFSPKATGQQGNRAIILFF
jgi:hypothetical protein